MATLPDTSARPRRMAWMVLSLSPAMTIFIVTNLVNVGNLSFNLIFSRWMGPEVFGNLTLLLTLKLAILGTLGAVQSAVSQRVASADDAGLARLKPQLAWINLAALIAGFAALPLLALVILAADLGPWLGLTGNGLVLLLLIGIPFSASLSLLRGVALGRLDVQKTVLSLLAEMIVRLIGAIIAWQLGFGLAGVICAVVLSVIASWAVVAGLLPWSSSIGFPKQTAKALGATVAPFALLYLAQVLALDGDIILGKTILPAEEAGLLAALILFQRIQFFACFGLASVLLPSVAIAVRGGQNVLPALMPVAALFAATTSVILGSAIIAPEYVLTLLVGPAYVQISGGLLPAALAAACFTFSFLIATALAALDDRNGIWAALAVAVLQLALMAIFTNDSPFPLNTLLQIKLTCQALLAVGLGLYAARVLERRSISRRHS